MVRRIVAVAVLMSVLASGVYGTNFLGNIARTSGSIFRPNPDDPSRPSVQVLTGREAREHLQNLKSRNPEAFAKSSAKLRAMGFRPTDKVTVVRTLRQDARKVQGSAYHPAQSTTITTDEGEAVFVSWDDGDGSTWEGELYAYRYATGAEAVNIGQVDVSTVNQYALWDEETYYDPGYQGPEHREIAKQGPGEGAPVLLASLIPVSGSPYIRTQATREPKPRIRDWVACVVGGCSGGLFGCVLAGPMYPECVVLNCAGFKVGCTLDFIIRNT